jgi:2-polyprenyl-3-methyl-5-hydroxy-6-metoxy-1,4-benzoquinol methylase
MTAYAIRGGEEGARRLDLLARVMAPATDALMAAAGIAPGMRCIDLGCGGGHVSQRLATLVGPGGRVVGVDFDAVKLAAARRASEVAGLRNLEFRQADVAAWSETEAYDFVYGRFIVSHLPGRPGFVARMCGALRTGGVLVLEDIDFRGAFCHPPDAAFDRACELYVEVIRRRGGDATVGAQLYQLCLDGGLEHVHVQVAQPTHGDRAPEKDLTLSTLRNIADAVLAEGLASADELQETIAALADYTEDPRSILGCPRIFQVWGRKPARVLVTA